MNFKKIIWGGILGSVVVTAILGWVRSLGVTSLNPEMVMGSFVTKSLNPGTGFTGFLLVLFLRGVITALIYGFCFERFMHRATWPIGAGFGAIHAILDGFIVRVISSLHPLMMPPPVAPGHLLAPGFFASNYGAVSVVMKVLLPFSCKELYTALVAHTGITVGQSHPSEFRAAY